MFVYLRRFLRTTANLFGINPVVPARIESNMQAKFTERAVERTDAPVDRPREGLDVRELGPPEPLTRTLERLADLDPETVLVQVNDRAPQHLYPKLADRGYEFETVDDEEAVLTTVWRET